LSAISGLHEIAGWPDRIPGEIGFYTDFIAPRFNALTLLAALDYRRRTGKGQFLDLAQHQAGIQFLAPLILDKVVNHRVATRKGNQDDYASPHGVYPCLGEDRWCAIASFSEEEWKSFCRVIGNPAWTEDHKFSTFEKRKENEKELNKLVGEWTIIHTDEEVMNLMQAAGVGGGRIGTSKDQMENDPHLKYRNFYQEQDHPEIGKYRPPRQPCLLSKTPCRIRRAPLIGEHTEYALKEILGLTDNEIEELVIEEVLE
jgi:benzylsuccinate CoA-transferase BbsF subunit